MPQTGPTMDEFNALSNRVAKLEQGSVTTPPPTTTPPQPTTGKQAKRVSDLIEIMGYNTFSSVDTGNVWGSWPADYRAETVIAAFDYMYKGTGFSPPIREYHYAGRESWQTPWIRKIKAAYPDVAGTVCVGANGSVADVASIIKMTTQDGDVWKYSEGINEPNTDFGSGQIPASRTIDIQRALQQGGAKGLMGPSIVFGLPGADGWIKDYFNNDMTVINSLLQYANGHYYPPHCPDIVADGTSITDVVGSLWNVYGNHIVALTEFHATLYNQDRGKRKADGTPLITDAQWDVLDAYYHILMMLRCSKINVRVWQYALFDYAQTYRCGMFPKDANNPRSVATAVKRLASLCSDPNSVNKYTFVPEKLDVVVTGADNRTDWDLYQTSTKKFVMPIWRANNQPGGTGIPITIKLPKTMQVSEHDILGTTSRIVGTVDTYTTTMPYGAKAIVLTS